MENENFDDLEREFIAEGRGNGWLHPALVPQPNDYWILRKHDQDVYLNFDFTDDDWSALYFGALHCSEREPYVQGEDIIERNNRWLVKFLTCCADYPMLGRISDMYEDAAFEANEVTELKKQCIYLRSTTNHEGAKRALAKLIIVCNKAIENQLGILLISD